MSHAQLKSGAPSTDHCLDSGAMSDLQTLDWKPERHEVRPWRQRTVRGPRVDRLTTEVTVSLPPLIASAQYPMDTHLSTMTAASAGGLGNLNLVHGRTLDGLNHLQLRAESIDSSKIENIDASLADYGRALLGVGANASAVSMASATTAMTRLIKDAAATGSIRLDAILDAHRELFARNSDEIARAGRVRIVQNWIGGSDYAPRAALYVPPPPETVSGYLDDLLIFANRDDLNPIAQAAIVHAQFESIHPFIDGNGRIGRALIHAVLRRRRVSRHLTTPIASALVADRDSYFAALGDYRAGRASTIVTMLARAASLATAECWTTAKRIGEIREAWSHVLGGTRPGTLLHRLLDELTEEPIINVDLMAQHIGATSEEIRQAIATAVNAGVLRPAPRSRRSPVWLANDVLAEVNDLSLRIQSASRTSTLGN